ncbi:MULTISPECIES: NmrA family NAD(P)-binding protein [unclassified Streptomyces]|uniref:NmrA family NAD(P)-binding protein n=1 Tax=unclassified Streptomyces TaxID=2593676 RepID=UPI00093C0D22|nr:NAD(P)H-binding protein [Streptomyces sp. CB02400]OKK03083.1 NmrA family transcriptional regulator [Streptomyces sp. CB02400]
MLIVTGATGRLGALIVDRLLERTPADRIGVSVRDVRKAAGLAERGVRVRAGDFTEPGGLKHAFEGAERVLVVSAAIRGDGAAAANGAAVDAAREAGARRILYTSHQAASPTSLFPPQRVHAATEEHLERQGVPCTALRNGFYAATLSHYIGAALETGTLAVPQDGPVSWTAHEDLAEAAALALTEDGALEGITPPLTAPHALDFADVAEILGRITGRTVTRVVMDDHEWMSAAVAGGMPRPAAEFALTMFTASREGEFDVVDPTLETVIGRPAKTVHGVLEAVVRSLRSAR